MSVYATVQYPGLLFKALNAVKLSKDRDCWATVIFTDTAVILHVEGSDQSSTATAMLPRKLFSDYAVSDARMEVHLQTLMDAMLLLGPHSLTTNAVTIRLLYGASDGRIMVELTDTAQDALGGAGGVGGVILSAAAAAAAAGIGGTGGALPGGRRVLQSRILTRPIKDNLLDLHFRDEALAAQATLLGDNLRDAINDLLTAQCAETTLLLNPRTMSVQLHGEGSPYGTVDIQIRKNSRALLSMEAGDALSALDGGEARTKVSTRHLALACGVGSAGGGGGTSGGRARGGGNTGGADAYGAAVVGGSGGGGGAGFERLTLQVNAQRQLSVLHTERDHDVKVTVTVVVNPLFDYDLTL